MDKPEVVVSFNNSFFRSKKLLLLIPIILVISLLLVLTLNKKQNDKNNTPAQLTPPSNLIFAPTIVPLPKVSAGMQKGPFNCPALADFCNKGIYTEKGIRAVLAKGTNLVAAFDGQIENYKIRSFEVNPYEDYGKIVLTNETRGLRAEYYFKGTPIPNQDVLRGDKIASLSGELVAAENNSSFAFNLLKWDGQKWINVKLSISDFK